MGIDLTRALHLGMQYRYRQRVPLAWADRSDPEATRNVPESYVWSAPRRRPRGGEAAIKNLQEDLAHRSGRG